MNSNPKTETVKFDSPKDKKKDSYDDYNGFHNSCLPTRKGSKSFMSPVKFFKSTVQPSARNLPITHWKLFEGFLPVLLS